MTDLRFRVNLKGGEQVYVTSHELFKSLGINKVEQLNKSTQAKLADTSRIVSIQQPTHCYDTTGNMIWEGDIIEFKELVRIEEGKYDVVTHKKKIVFETGAYGVADGRVFIPLATLLNDVTVNDMIEIFGIDRDELVHVTKKLCEKYDYKDLADIIDNINRITIV